MKHSLTHASLMLAAVILATFSFDANAFTPSSKGGGLITTNHVLSKPLLTSHHHHRHGKYQNKFQIVSLRSSKSDSDTEDKSTSTTTTTATATTTAPSPPAPVEVNSSSSNNNDDDITSRLLAEGRELLSSASLVFQYLTQKDDSVTAEQIVKLCDDLDKTISDATKSNLFTVSTLQTRINALKLSRYQLLNKMLKTNYDAYIATASFLSPSRIPRSALPNVQDVPFPSQPIMPKSIIDDEDGTTKLVADCTLDDLRYQESPLDKLLLKIFRSFVQQNTNGITSTKEGIAGLLEQGRTYMTQPNQTPQAQQKMVYDTLGGLMTPALPPFYRIFMSGIVPSNLLGTKYDGKQFGPWFYAPWLTSFVTPTFFGFLVGPSKPNSRKDGQPGGLVVEKCKFLQESGCKGMCLNMCKLPAQDFFKEELGLALTVSPNFVTQECQWSFGEEPLPPAEDPSFPKGCLAGCESRKVMAERGTSSSQLMCE